MNKKLSCVIVDIDGVLADHAHRIHLAHNKDWEAYHGLSFNDPPHTAIVKLVALLSVSFGIAFVTGRPERFKEVTLSWLRRQFDFDIAGGYFKMGWSLCMRGDADHRPNATLKKEILDIIREGNFREIWFAIDDQSSVKAMYQQAGIVCLQPHEILHTEGKSETKALAKKLVPEILEGAASTYAERQGVYRNTWTLHGKVMKQIFPEGISLNTEDDFLRYHLFVLEMIKMIRTARSGLDHLDSQHDLMVYAAMFEETIRAGGKK